MWIAARRRAEWPASLGWRPSPVSSDARRAGVGAAGFCLLGDGAGRGASITGIGNGRRRPAAAALGNVEEERVLLGMTVLMNTNIRCGETLAWRQPGNRPRGQAVRTACARGRRAKITNLVYSLVSLRVWERGGSRRGPECCVNTRRGGGAAESSLAAAAAAWTHHDAAPAAPS